MQVAFLWQFVVGQSLHWFPQVCWLPGTRRITVTSIKGGLCNRRHYFRIVIKNLGNSAEYASVAENLAAT